MSTLQRVRPKTQQISARSQTVAETQTQTGPGTQQPRSRTDNDQVQQTEVQQSELRRQSIEVVKELVQVGLSCVAYIRGLFPESYFSSDKILPALKHNPQPDSVMNQPRRPNRLDSEMTHVNVRKLNRGNSAEAEAFIDWFEKGIVVGLETAWIDQLILAIYLDPEDPTNIIEAWKFNFDHFTTQDGTRHPRLQVRDRNDKLVVDQEEFIHTPDSINRSAHRILKSIFAAAGEMGDLPPRRYVNARIIKSANAPEHWDPPHFRKVDFATEAAIKFNTPSIEDEPERTQYGSLVAPGPTVAVESISIADYVGQPDADETVDEASALAFACDEANSRMHQWAIQVYIPATREAVAHAPVDTTRAQLVQTPDLATDGGAGEATAEEHAPLQRMRRGGERALEPVTTDSTTAHDTEENAPVSSPLSSAPSGAEEGGDGEVGEVGEVEVYGCPCGAGEGQVQGCIDIACSVCEEWWHGWCLGLSWDDRDSIPDFVACFNCRAEEARQLAKGDPQRQEALGAVMATLKTLAIKRRLLAIYCDFPKITPHSTAAATLDTTEAVVETIFGELVREKIIKHKAKNRVAPGELPFTWYEEASSDKYRHKTYFTPDEGREADIFAGLARMVEGWKDGTWVPGGAPSESQSTQVDGGRNLRRQASLQPHSTLSATTVSSSQPRSRSSTPRPARLSHPSSTTASTASTVGGLARDVGELSLPQSSAPARPGQAKKPPMLKGETVGMCDVAGEDEDEIESGGVEVPMEEDDIEDFEDSAVPCDDLDSPRTQARQVEESTAKSRPSTHSAETTPLKESQPVTSGPEQRPRPGQENITVPRSKQPTTARAIERLSPLTPAKAKPTAATPHPAKSQPKRSSFKSPLVPYKPPAPRPPPLPRAPPKLHRSGPTVSQRLAKLMKVDSIIAEEEEEEEEPDTQPDDEPVAEAEAEPDTDPEAEEDPAPAPAPNSSPRQKRPREEIELVQDTPPSSASSVAAPAPEDGVGSTPQPAQRRPTVTISTGDKRPAEDEAEAEREASVDTDREVSKGVAEAGGAAGAAQRAAGSGVKRRRVGVSGPIVLCFTKAELGIAPEDGEDED